MSVIVWWRVQLNESSVSKEGKSIVIDSEWHENDKNDERFKERKKANADDDDDEVRK